MGLAVLHIMGTHDHRHLAEFVLRQFLYPHSNAAMAISAEVWAQQQAVWNEWVKELTENKFSKVTVIVRPHNMENGQPHPYAWSPLAYSAADCVATQWEKTDADGNKTMINENQELLNDWRSQQYLSGDAKALSTFHFYQKAFKIIRRF